MGLDIDLTSVEGVAESGVGESLLPAGDLELSIPEQLLLRSLESHNGIAVETKSKEAASALRFKCYRARKTLQERGHKHFDQLVLTIAKSDEGSGWDLRIVPIESFTIREL